MKIILGSKYQSYKKALDVLDLETLDERREYLSLEFAQKCAANEKYRKAEYVPAVGWQSGKCMTPCVDLGHATLWQIIF